MVYRTYLQKQPTSCIKIVHMIFWLNFKNNNYCFTLLKDYFSCKTLVKKHQI